jgi:hypothetical protein
MCAQDRSHSHRVCQTHGGDHLASSTRKPALTRMPKIAGLATAVRFTRTLPTVSARVPSHTVSRPTQTVPAHNTTLCIQLPTPSLNPRPALSVSNDPTCQHRRSHAFVQGRWIPFCLSCSDDKKTDDSPTVTSSQDLKVKTTITIGAFPVLQTMQGFPFDLRRSRVEACRLME